MELLHIYFKSITVPFRDKSQPKIRLTTARVVFWNDIRQIIAIRKFNHKSYYKNFRVGGDKTLGVGVNVWE